MTDTAAQLAAVTAECDQWKVIVDHLKANEQALNDRIQVLEDLLRRGTLNTDDAKDLRIKALDATLNKWAPIIDLLAGNTGGTQARDHESHAAQYGARLASLGLPLFTREDYEPPRVAEPAAPSVDSVGTEEANAES